MKLKDADLVSFPLRGGIGEKPLAKREVELKPRGGALTPVKAEEAAAKARGLLATLAAPAPAR